MREHLRFSPSPCMQGVGRGDEARQRRARRDAASQPLPNPPLHAGEGEDSGRTAQLLP